ncbi:hypothetical protein ACFL3A_06600 [Pseudomonadota bacterium]
MRKLRAPDRKRGRSIIPGKKSLSFLALVLATPLALVGVNLHTFHRLTDEAQIARLRFVEMAPRQYAVELRTGDFCSPQHFAIKGDEWRLDARFLKWKPLANLIGFDAMYRLDRLSGRYSDIDAANNAPHVAFQVGEKPVVDLTDYLRGDWKYWSPVDTSFGSSVYEVIDPAYEYTVYRTQSALLIRKEIITASHYEGGALVIQIEKPCGDDN